MHNMPSEETRKLVEKAFWWLLGVASTLFISAATAVVGVLWSMNGSIATLNERVGRVIEESNNLRQEVKDQLTGFASRLHHIEAKSHQDEREP